MRYDTPVYFQKFTPPRYDPSTGDYVEGPVEESMRYASIMNTATERIMQVYGQMKQGSLIIQLQNHYDCPDPCRQCGVSGGFFPEIPCETCFYCIGGAEGCQK